MKKINIQGYEFIEFSKEKARIIFSTAKNNLNFYSASLEGQKNLLLLKQWFPVEEVGYLHQIHSDFIYDYDGNRDEGDALITNQSNTAIGIFTADCVPVILVDTEHHVAAAVHSGWRGTLASIVPKAVERMKKEYQVEPEQIHAYIGPHNQGCCYEIGEEVISQFMSQEIFKGTHIIRENKLDLQQCITLQLFEKGILPEHICTTNLCTYCNKESELYSYRKAKDKEKRMFSFVYFTE